MIDFFLSKIVILLLFIKYFFIELFNKNIIIIGYFPIHKGKVGMFNYGDDLNFHLIELISGRKVIPYSYSLLSRLIKRDVYSCVGSILGWNVKKARKIIVWGSGAMFSDIKINRSIELEVLSVRGPLSRSILMENNINCPAIYGDPAVLLSMFYQPAVVKKKYKVGIIPHYVDKNNILLDYYYVDESVTVIDVQHSGDWLSFIDIIVSCDVIISSSLHGLIIADSYNIPNLWVEFSNNVAGFGFKFQDYFLSSGRFDVKPLLFDRYYSVNELTQMVTSWTPPIIDKELLLRKCPFYFK
jgi:pyruvyltransferase